MAERPPPLIPTMQTTQPQRGNRQVLRWIVIGGAVVAVLFVLWLSSGRKPIVRDLMPDRPAPEQTVLGTPGASPDSLRYSTTMFQPPPAQQAPAVQPPPPQQVLAPPPQPGATTPPAMAPPGRPPVIQAPSVNIHPAPPPAQRGPAPAPATGQAPKKDGPKRWFTTGQPKVTATWEPPIKDDPKELEAQQGKLFPPALWERPRNPYKVLYWHQRIRAVLHQAINSDIPGVFLLNTTEDVMDAWGHGHVIVPRDTWLLGKQEGQASFGQELIPGTVIGGNFPDGSSVSWEGQVQAQSGSTGIPASVDNHWGKLLLGTGLQVLLNYSVRGTQAIGVGQYQPGQLPDPTQEISRGVTQAARPLLDRFNVKPTLTQEFGYPVTVMFTRNVSFQSPPAVMSK